ncbi:YrhB domain-containing protein [Nocardioides sp. J9]|uniref:YrhB domain-containing protein n=1 Tax=Nocardioides sp. J9 TaxID=935844 RepID=UPI0016463225|nr:YrhB domain-containing protein [Nocardioides sp. J9]
MDANDAKRIAEAELARWNSTLTPNRLVNPQATSHDPRDGYVVTSIETHSRAWIVHFATKRWLETRSISDSVVGTCPLVIDRATGELHAYGSAEHSKFHAWLDEPQV